MPREWRERVEDILGVIEEIRGYVEGMPLEVFAADTKTVRAVAY